MSSSIRTCYQLRKVCTFETVASLYINCKICYVSMNIPALMPTTEKSNLIKKNKNPTIYCKVIKQPMFYGNSGSDIKSRDPTRI